MAEFDLKIIPLGGVGEFGMNMVVYETVSDIIIIDCGMMFPENYMLGVDCVIPDITYLKENKEKIRAIVITHSHEDHIGGLPYILPELDVPVAGSPLSLEMIHEKLIEFELADSLKQVPAGNGEILKFGDFEVEFIKVSHSIPDAATLAIKTPSGTIIHSGDFKFDLTPADNLPIPFESYVKYAERGILALLSDSTNSEQNGFSRSELEIVPVIYDIIKNARQKVIVTLFSSNLIRIQKIFDIAEKLERKVFILGRSLLANIRIARKLEYIKVCDDLIYDITEINDYPPEEVILITTGSQGEPNSALLLMSTGSHKHVKLQQGDTVILSSKMIPGNEKAIGSMINNLYRKNAEVFYEKIADIHVSGHGYAEEQKLLINLVKPKYFFPIHGEYRHLLLHAKTAEKSGIPKGNIKIVTNGDVIKFQNGICEISEKVESGRVFVDGKGVGDVGSIVLKDRKHLSEDGVVVSVIALNLKTGEIVSGPDLLTKGFVFEEENMELLEKAKELVIKAVGDMSLDAKSDKMEIQEEVRVTLRRFFNKVIRRKPIIFSIVVDM